jgi:hypothetical protein
LKKAIATTPANAFPLLLQRRIIGPGCGIFLLVWEGRTLATFAHRRLREFPPSGGASVLSESVLADPLLVSRSRALLDRFDWQGVAMVEYKIEAATGTPYLMEVNGRFWGSLQLAIDAGVDFPTLLISAATGRFVGPQPSYRPGVRLRSLWRDLLHLSLRLRRSPAALNLASDAPDRWPVFWDTIRWYSRTHDDVWRWWDPRPFLSETLAFWKERFGPQMDQSRRG